MGNAPKINRGFSIHAICSNTETLFTQLIPFCPSFPWTRESRLSTISSVESLDSHFRGSDEVLGNKINWSPTALRLLTWSRLVNLRFEGSHMPAVFKDKNRMTSFDDLDHFSPTSPDLCDRYTPTEPFRCCSIAEFMVINLVLALLENEEGIDFRYIPLAISVTTDDHAPVGALVITGASPPEASSVATVRSADATSSVPSDPSVSFEISPIIRFW